MLRALALVVAALCLAACSSAPPTATPTTSQPPVLTPSLPPSGAFDKVYGSYRTESGDVLVVTRMGWFADLADSTYRTIYGLGSPGRFSIGPGFQQPAPVVAELQIGSDGLTLSQAGGTVVAKRLNLNRSEVTIHADGADLAGTITEPEGSGPHPGIVIVHGSEPGQRYYYDFWVSLYTSLGLAVLTYDKRGHGASTGSYPGEYASQQALTTYADDASASLAELARWPGVDAKRVGFHGGSQGGWIVPLAISRHGLAAFAMLASGPAVTVDQQGIWSAFTGGGARLPSRSPEEMYAAVLANHTGYDPAPALASLDMPVLWLLGRNDRSVPTDICVENINQLQKPNLRIQLVDSGHGLLVNQTGLDADDKTSPGLAPGVVSSISDWIRLVT